MDTTSDDLQFLFPGLSTTGFDITSPIDSVYNCIAWAAGDQRKWWEPDPMRLYYWPEGAPREYTVPAWQKAFEVCGFVVCETEVFEDGTDRVALFALGGQPKHACRQISPDKWTSKLGPNVDISHELRALSGGRYGEPVCLLKRVLSNA